MVEVVDQGLSDADAVTLFASPPAGVQASILVELDSIDDAPPVPAMTEAETAVAEAYKLLPRKVQKVILAKLKSIEGEAPSPQRTARLIAWLDSNRQVAVRVQTVEHRGHGSQPTAETLHARRTTGSAGDDGAGDDGAGEGAASNQLVYHNRKPRPDEGRGFLHLNRSG